MSASSFELKTSEQFTPRLARADLSLSPTAPVSNTLPPNPQTTESSLVKYQLVFHLTASNCEPYNTLTFPNLQQRWRTRPPQGRLIGISASVAGAMVGLAIAELKPEPNFDKPQAELISLFVLPKCRRQGIGTRLVKHLEAALITQCCSRIQVSYRVSELTGQALEPLFRRQQWDAPQTTFLLGKTSTAEISKAPWVYNTRLPQRFKMLAWTELTAAQRQQMQQTLPYPTALNPFGKDPRVEPLNSLALQQGDEIVGWMLTHRVAPDMIRYSTMYVAPHLQRLGRGVALVAEAIRRQIDSPVPHYSFSVAAENEPMAAFLQRRLAPYLSYLGESRQCHKPLHGN